MKDYKDVVTNRFDFETEKNNSIYSPNHPIGKYVRIFIFNGLNKFLKFYIKEHGNLKSKKLLDIGCGSGGMLEFFISKGFLPQHTSGIDLSKTRIKQALEKNPLITFINDDALTFSLNEQKFDLITSFDLFSHLTTKEQIMQGLINVKNHLKDNGVFLWYDIYSTNHFSPPTQVDSWGFSKDQMISLCEEAGFEMIYYRSFFKNFFNKYHSIYQVKRLHWIFVKILEAILPGTPGNIMLVFKVKRGNRQ